MRTPAATALAATAAVALLTGCGSSSDNGGGTDSGGGSDVTVSLKKALTSKKTATQACKTLLGVHDAKSAQKVSDQIAVPRKGTAKVTGITGKSVTQSPHPTFLSCDLDTADPTKNSGTYVVFGTSKALTETGADLRKKNDSGLIAATDSKTSYRQIGYTLQPTAQDILKDAVGMLKP